MDTEEIRDVLTIFIIMVVIFFGYAFVYQAHFVSTPYIEEIKKARQRVQYMPTSDWYPFSSSFPPLYDQIRSSTLAYRNQNFVREFGNYGPADIALLRSQLK